MLVSARRRNSPASQPEATPGWTESLFLALRGLAVACRAPSLCLVSGCILWLTVAAKFAEANQGLRRSVGWLLWAHPGLCSLRRTRFDEPRRLVVPAAGTTPTDPSTAARHAVMTMLVLELLGLSPRRSVRAVGEGVGWPS